MTVGVGVGVGGRGDGFSFVEKNITLNGPND